MSWIHALDAALTWLFSYPLLPLQIVLFLLMAWGRLGYGVGVDDLFWSQRTREQILNGLACGFLFAEILLVRYLLDPGHEWVKPIPVTLFPVGDAAVRLLGRFLAVFWIASLLALWGFKLLSRDVWHGEVRIWPLLVGLVVSVGVTTALVCAGAELGLFHLWRLGPLHTLAAATAILFGLATAALYAAHFAGKVLSPVVVVCVLLGAADAGYGFLAFNLPGSQFLVLIGLIAVALLFNSPWVNKQNSYKLTFPGLDAFNGARQRIDEEAVYDEKTHAWVRTEHYHELLKAQAADPATGPDLIPAAAPLAEMETRWQARHGDQSKPRIVIVCTSGGGIRAAVWTAVVLEGLEAAFLGDPATGTAALRDHLRMFTGASGGMVGAGLYAANFENGPLATGPRDPATELGPLSGLLARDSLRRTVQTMALVDQPTLFWPGQVAWDRGRETERVWAASTAALGTGAFTGSPFSRPFRDLKPLEAQGLRPSLLFSPMLVEDARRLLVSNLDLLDLTWTAGNVAGFGSFRDKYGIPNAPDESLLSLSAVELFRLFPAAAGTFSVGTAARMNASFPLVSPGVSLPTVPARRVVDAGYYDNFGVNLAAMWLLRNAAAVRAHTSGVAVIEIRAYRNGYARWHFQDQEAEKFHPDPSRGAKQTARRDKDAVAAALEWLSTPVEAIDAARGRGAYYRNDELLDLLDKHFNATTPDFFTSLAFECEVDAALSWTLPDREARRISRAFYGDPTAADDMARRGVWTIRRIAALRKWFGNGGR
jgi:hypothetical protein